MYLGRWDLLSLFGQGHCLGSKNVWWGWGGRVENSWTGLLLWFPAQVRLWVGLCKLPGFCGQAYLVKTGRRQS